MFLNFSSLELAIKKKIKNLNKNEKLNQIIFFASVGQATQHTCAGQLGTSGGVEERQLGPVQI
jgi:hypothetical protein